MTTATEKKATANEHKAPAVKAVPATETKPVAKAAPAVEASAEKGKGVSADKSGVVEKRIKVDGQFREDMLKDERNIATFKAHNVTASPDGDTIVLKGKNQGDVDYVGRMLSESFKHHINILGGKNGTKTPWATSNLKYYTKEELAAMKTPWVMLHGVIIEPEETGLKESHRIVTKSGQAFWLNGRSNAGKDEPRDLTYYKVSVEGFEVHLLLDAKSSCQFGGAESYRRGSPHPSEYTQRIHNGINQVVLLNSDSTYDTFLGDVVLENQSTRGCYFNNSTVSSESRNPQASFAPWVARSENLKRQELRYSNLFASSIYNCTIAESVTLKETTLDNSTIKVSEEFTAEYSRIKDSSIKGTFVKLKWAQLDKTHIPSTGAILIVNTVMKDENLSAKSLYIPNKFCTLKVDLPHDHLSMRRENQTKVGITIGWRQPVEFDISSTVEVIDAKVREVLRDSSYHNPLDPDLRDPVINNMIHYVVQSIRSRLRVITMLDSAVKTARVVTGEGYREHEEGDGFGSYNRPF